VSHHEDAGKQINGRKHLRIVAPDGRVRQGRIHSADRLEGVKAGARTTSARAAMPWRSSFRS
jgi:hypothetical protein